jgi:hypothetical protein
MSKTKLTALLHAYCTLPCYAQFNRHTEQMLATADGLKLGMYGGKGFITAHSTEIAH